MCRSIARGWSCLNRPDPCPLIRPMSRISLSSRRSKSEATSLRYLLVSYRAFGRRPSPRGWRRTRFTAARWRAVRASGGFSPAPLGDHAGGKCRPGRELPWDQAMALQELAQVPALLARRQRGPAHIAVMVGHEAMEIDSLEGLHHPPLLDLVGRPALGEEGHRLEARAAPAPARDPAPRSGPPAPPASPARWRSPALGHCRASRM